MVVFPRAKINIGLRITGKREDGFHNIETLFLPINLNDALEFVTGEAGSTDDELTVTGYATGGLPADNLVIKAVNLIREKRHFPRLRIHLHKAIPAGSGLGGGSSDASAMLVGLNRYFSLGLKKEELLSMALQLGSDCPLFIECTPALASGRGEVLEPYSIIEKGLTVVVVFEDFHISTAEAYQNCTPSKPGHGLKELLEAPPVNWRQTITNDFEPYAFNKFPKLADIKESLYSAGAIYSSLSGSGSAVYGIFTGEPKHPHLIRGNVIFKGAL